ncbi:unnamed protein product, partial [marine sediment metagenome]
MSPLAWYIRIEEKTQVNYQRLINLIFQVKPINIEVIVEG